MIVRCNTMLSGPTILGSDFPGHGTQLGCGRERRRQPAINLAGGAKTHDLMSVRPGRKHTSMPEVGSSRVDEHGVLAHENVVPCLEVSIPKHLTCAHSAP